MKIIINHNEIIVKHANNPFIRFIGLMGKKRIKTGLFLPNCSSIHTFFMKDKIDVIMLDHDYLVIRLIEELTKNKIINYPGTKHIIELPKGSIKLYKIKLKEKVEIIN